MSSEGESPSNIKQSTNTPPAQNESKIVDPLVSESKVIEKPQKTLPADSESDDYSEVATSPL